MVSTINILGYRIKFVFRHRFEKETNLYDRFEWRSYELGIWYKKYKSLFKPKDGPATIGQNSKLTNVYMFGVNLIICKFWIDISYRPLILKIDK